MSEYNNENEGFLVKELSIITGLYVSTLNNSDLPFESLIKVPNTNKPAKFITYRTFESYLEKTKVWPFSIPEYNKYYHQKRPVIRHFLSVSEAVKFMKLYGLHLHIRTIHKKIHKQEIPAYQLTGKYLIPILFLIKAFVIEINDELDQNISNIIGEDYKFKL